MKVKENLILRQLFVYVGPAVLGLLVNALYNIVDRIFVGQFVGAEGLSAVTMVFPVSLLQFSFVLLFGSGAGVLIAKFLGESKPEKAAAALGNMMAGLVVITVVFTILGLLFYRKLLMLFGAEGELLNLSAEYLHVIILGFPLSFFIALAFTCRAEGNPGFPAKLVLISSIINISLDLFFMKGFDMGVRGAALATIIAQAVNSLLLIGYYVGGKSHVKLVWENVKLQKKVIIPVMLLGLAPFIMDGATSFQNIIANNLLLQSGGTKAVAVMGIIFGVNVFFMMTALGIGDGIQPIISYNLGAEKYKDNHKTLYYTMTIVGVIGVIGLVLLEFFPNLIISIFINENEDIRSLAQTALRIFALSIPFYMIQIIATRYFQAIHENRIAVFFAILRPILLFVPIAYLLNGIWGLNGIWFSFVVSDSIAALVALYFVRKAQYKTVQLA